MSGRRRVVGAGRRGAGWLLLLAGLLTIGLRWLSMPVEAQGSGPAVLKVQDPDRMCAGCHAAIYAAYEKTTMAQGSGLARDGMLTGGFRHAESGVEYRMFTRDGRAWMHYERSAEEAARDGKPAMAGERELAYFIGSGKRGRTYLYQVDGQWFELPINWYGKRAVWDMAPAYEQARTMPAVLPVDPNCLHCHATGVSAAEPEARSKYAGAPFAQGGVGCRACHGDPAAHLAGHGHGPITNPGRLSPARRDSACLQCHLEGDAVVYRPGKSLATYVPGDDLADSAVYFVKESSRDGGRRAASQYEAMLRSACRAAVGDRLTCTTCHDPHSSPSAEERVEYFRSRCLSCHTGRAMALEHHPEQQDCAVCHMPTRKTSDISHEQLTDHNIQRRPVTDERGSAGVHLSGLNGVETETLVPVGEARAGGRELGLAYAQLAELGDHGAAVRARGLLEAAEKNGQASGPVHVRLGFLEQVAGVAARAREEYELALELNPHEGAALGNLAVLDAGAGDVRGALRLLTRLMDADQSQTVAGLNLAFLECRLGAPEQAAALLRGLERFNPDDAQLQLFLRRGEYGGQRCVLPSVAGAGKSSLSSR